LTTQIDEFTEKQEADSLDEFTNTRFDQLALAFVEIYVSENKTLAAKFIHEEKVAKEKYPILRDKINQEFLRRGYTFESQTS